MHIVDLDGAKEGRPIQTTLIKAIIKAIRRFAPDLVVLASQGETAVRPGDHGMTTEDVVWNSPKPVVVIPATRSPA